MREALSNEFLPEIIDMISYLPDVISDDKQWKLSKEDVYCNLLLDISRLVDREKLIDLIIDYIEAYDIEVDENYYKE